MSQRKSTTKTNQKSRAELRKQLARDLESILLNPETPAALYNEISDCLSDFEGDAEWYKADYIERAINNHYRKEEKRKGGARLNG